MTKLPIMEHVPIVRGQVKTRTENDDIRRAPLSIHEIPDRRGTQVRLLFEPRRKEAIKGFFVQWFVEQELSERPVFVPIGSFVRRIVEHQTTRI
jgi:hypothetical protein